MNFTRCFSLITLFFLCVAFHIESASASERFKSQRIPEIMNDILDLHVDQREIEPFLLQRSLKIFLDQFDSSRRYLLAEDVKPFLNLSEKKLQQVLREYQQGDITIYRELSQRIQESIVRVREIRSSFQYQWNEVLAEANSKAPIGLEKDDKWVTNQGDLHIALRSDFARFVRGQQTRKGDEYVLENQDEILALYEKQVREYENEYLFLDEEGRILPKKEREDFLALRVLKSLAKSLDAHTTFFSGQEAYEMRVQLEKGFQGIGVMLQDNIDGVTITRLIDGGPAKKSGLVKVDDQIIEVDGESIVNFSFKKVLNMIRGKGGSILSLGLKRIIEDGGEKIAHEVKVRLKRGRVVLDDKRVDVTTESVGDGIIGRIVLHSFYDSDKNDISSEKDVKQAIRDLRKRGNLKGIVLDLRENMGGFLMQAVKVAGLFITNGVVVVAKYSDDGMKYFRDVDGYAYFDGPLVLLVSKASASAAEIVAQTLQDYGAAVIVGDEHTYGKGSIQHQTVTDERSKSFFKVTVGRYYTVSGKSTQIDGVRSDIIVPTRFFKREIGEEYLEYPLPSDVITPAFDDLLVDLDWDSKRWYKKYYIPSLQKEKTIWREMLPVLSANSKRRLENSEEFQAFLEGVETSKRVAKTDESEKKDLQMIEATKVIEDMILLESQYRQKQLYVMENEKISK